MACVFSEGTSNFFSLQWEANATTTDHNSPLTTTTTTADILDVLPYSVEEAAQKFGESFNNLSFSVVEAVQSALYDSNSDFSFPSSLHASKCFDNNGTKDLQHQNPNATSQISQGDLFCKIQLCFNNSDAVLPITPVKECPQSKLYTGNAPFYEYESWPMSSEYHHPLVEVSPGFIVRLRGYSETMLACSNPGQTVASRCVSCKTSLRCVHDAEFVLCQRCRFISPVQQAKRDFRCSDDSKDFKLGGGLAFGAAASETLVESASSNLKHKRSRVSVDDDNLQPKPKKRRTVLADDRKLLPTNFCFFPFE